jgi:hypothetical protein
VAATLLGVAICAACYLSVAAVRIEPNAFARAMFSIDRAALGYGIAFGMVVVLATVYIIARLPAHGADADVMAGSGFAR